jgi:hypothetical protein
MMPIPILILLFLIPTMILDLGIRDLTNSEHIRARAYPWEMGSLPTPFIDWKLHVSPLEPTDAICFTVQNK